MSSSPSACLDTPITPFSLPFLKIFYHHNHKLLNIYFSHPGTLFLSYRHLCEVLSSDIKTQFNVDLPAENISFLLDAKVYNEYDKSVFNARFLTQLAGIMIVEKNDTNEKK